jgi:hypothetical protein
MKKIAKKRNPRYLITTGEGDELGIFPAFNAVEAVKRARQIYPGRKKLSAKKVDERMYIGNDRAKQIEDRERMARKIERAASRKRNPLTEADAAHIYHEMNEAGQGFAIGEDYDDIGTAAAASGWHVVHRYEISLLLAEDPAGRQFLVGGDGQGRGPWAVSIPQQNPRRAVSRTVTRRAVARGVVQPRRRNRTYIHADNIDHLDVAKVHNPYNERGEWVMDLNHVPGENAELDALYADPELRALEYEMEHDARHQLLKDLVLSGEASAIELSEYHNDERPRRLIARALEIINARSLRNPASASAEYPIEVVHHYRGGPPGYVPAFEQALAKDGANQRAYASGIKIATASQLPRLVDMGMRIGKGLQAIKSDLTATGRFTATGIANAIDKAKARAKNPRRAKAKNPKGSAKTRELYEKFNGRPARKTTTKSAPNGTPKNVAKLGGLRLIKTSDGRKWKFSGSGAPDLAADSRGRLHVVGGSYRANPAGEPVGEIEQIEYETKKPHLGQPQQTIYYHRLGEEGGKRPRLVIDREGLIKIHGGDYRIEADGIHD